MLGVAGVGAAEIAVIPATIGAIAAVVAAFIGSHNRARLERVEVQVNGRMDEAIKEIGELKAALVEARRSNPDNGNDAAPPPSK